MFGPNEIAQLVGPISRVMYAPGASPLTKGASHRRAEGMLIEAENILFGCFLGQALEVVGADSRMTAHADESGRNCPRR